MRRGKIPTAYHAVVVSYAHVKPTSQSDPDSAPNFPELDIRRATRQRVLASEVFLKSPRLSSFLSYICEKAIHGHIEEINETQIGVHVFGSDSNYSPNDDSIVRSQARLLRPRLDLYYRDEGKDDSLRIALRKGSYVPHFEASAVPVPDAEIPAAPSIPEAVKRVRWPWVAAGAAAIVVVAAVVAIPAFLSRQAARPTHELWKSLFGGNRNTMIVPADSTLVILEDVMGKPIYLQEYLDRSYRSGSALPPRLGPLSAENIAAHQFTSIADLMLVSGIVRLPEATAGRPMIRYARDLRLGGNTPQSMIVASRILPQ
jgi:hypothetical protein